MNTKGIPIKEGTLSVWWVDRLSENMEKHFPDIIGYYELVDHWKRDGWNDGTTTLHGVYHKDNTYVWCSFPDYEEPYKKVVKPKFEHTGWKHG